MPRVAGANIVAVLAGALALFFIGFLIYAVLFQEVWSQQLLENHGIVGPGEGASLTGEALTDALATIPQQLDMGLAMGLGFVVSLVTSFGLAVALGLMKTATMGQALGRAVLLWMGFAATTLAYNVVYYSESSTMYLIDLIHLLVGFLAASAIIFAIDGKNMGSTAPAMDPN